MSNLKRMFNKAGNNAKQFFNKTAMGTKQFFSKSGEGNKILGGIQQGLNIGGNIASDVGKGLSLLGPEAMPLSMALQRGGMGAQRLSGSIRNARQKTGLLEAPKSTNSNNEPNFY